MGSNRPHLAQGVMKALIVNRMTQAGCRFVFWVADWFALMNNKLGGDLKIQTVGKYMIEVWSALGMDLDKVEFRWASEHINSNANDYWLRVLDIARTSTYRGSSAVRRSWAVMKMTTYQLHSSCTLACSVPTSSTSRLTSAN